MKKRSILIVSILGFCNIAIWLVSFIMSYQYPLLLGLVALAYGLGLRHAVDADHIAAIDNTTRKLMQEGKKPVAVGFFFSLGHSTVVIILSVLAAFSASFVKHNLPSLQHTGALIGTSVSSFFLLAIGIINVFVLLDILKVWQHVKNGGTYSEHTVHEHLEKRGLLARMLKPLLKTVENSWAMYPIGFLFGLGFDTASEVGLLSISAATGASGIPFWYIILLPLAFTVGMAFIDTLDGILMLGAYGWAYIKPIRKLYYNMTITFVSVVIALFIGGIEGLQIISDQTGITGGIFTIINNLKFDNLGFIILGVFIASWLISLTYYKCKRYDSLQI